MAVQATEADPDARLGRLGRPGQGSEALRDPDGLIAPAVVPGWRNWPTFSRWMVDSERDPAVVAANETIVDGVRAWRATLTSATERRW